MERIKIFLKVDDAPLHKITKRILEEKGYVVVEDLGNAEADEMAKVAIIGLNNYHGKLLADKLREMIPGIGVIPFSQTMSTTVTSTQPVQSSHGSMNSSPR